MKILFLFLLLLMFHSCTYEKKVFWCGDHACANNEEKKLYFKETMTVEVKKMNNRNNTNDSDIINKILNKEKKSSVHLENFPKIPSTWENKKE